MKVLSIQAIENCTGCKICELSCSFKHFSCYIPSKSCIRIELDGLPEIPTVKVCRQCAEANCMSACPTGALCRDEENGVIFVDPDLCTGCGACVKACEYGAIFIDKKKRIAMKCDLCGGEPACVKNCPRGVLAVSEVPFKDQKTVDIRERLARYNLKLTDFCIKEKDK